MHDSTGVFQMRHLTVLVSLICMLFTADAAKADRRVAFVVGNGTYKNVSPLPNPPIDAKSMAAVLRNVGFEVVEGTNLTRDKMTERLLDFGKKAQGADVAVFFYAGHGIAINGTNYLLPVDADIKSEMDVKLGAAINIDLTLDQTMSDAKVKLVFLDACRDNPFAAKIKSNTATPGVEIQQAMTKVRAQVNEETNKGQLPWGHTNLIGSVYLNPVAAPAANAAAPAVTGTVAAASPSGGSDVELEFWRSIKESNKPEELNAYLTNYPNGQFKSLALARIASLESGPSTATRTLSPGIDPAPLTEAANQTTEDQIGLDKGKRRDVQRRLTGLGFDTKLTGVFDDPTRAVITRWQAARGYPQSGFLNKLQHKALLTEIGAVAPPTAAREAPVEKPARPARASAGNAAAPPPPQRGPDPGGAAFVGGLMGGVVGGILRR